MAPQRSDAGRAAGWWPAWSGPGTAAGVTRCGNDGGGSARRSIGAWRGDGGCNLPWRCASRGRRRRRRRLVQAARGAGTAVAARPSSAWRGDGGSVAQSEQQRMRGASRSSRLGSHGMRARAGSGRRCGCGGRRDCERRPEDRGRLRKEAVRKK